MGNRHSRNWHCKGYSNVRVLRHRRSCCLCCAKFLFLPPLSSSVLEPNLWKAREGGREEIEWFYDALILDPMRSLTCTRASVRSTRLANSSLVNTSG